ncbi:MAG: YicC/YloC family endoribonuclease [Candidatus Faecousia sp.]|nr:YicC/YloC family endoribonuclease [Candidatus Faecousia sp.]
MVKSMTGYGRAVETVDGREITVEIRSVNNRYLDCSVKLPRLYAFAEDALKQRVRQSVSRGKVDVYVTVNVTQSNHVKISLNRPLLEGYLQAMRTAAADYGVKDDISVTALTSMPDVLVVEKEAEDEKQMTQALLSVTEKALEAYNAMRLTEGRALEEDLRRKGKNILALVEKVEQRSPITVAEYRARLTAKMEEVLASTAVDEARILTEAAIFADKIAVDEETVRLRSHLAQLDTMLGAREPVGRKLDFLMQEMNREANTIGSKGNDIQQARTVVDIKAELEKIREQIQNIE